MFDIWLTRVLWCSDEVVHILVLVYFILSAVYAVIISSDRVSDGDFF